MTPLHGAAQADNPAVAEALIAGGADPNARTEGALAPLHMAAGAGSPAVVEALIAGGADMSARDESGRFPFDHAKKNKALRGTDVYRRLNEARSEE